MDNSTNFGVKLTYAKYSESIVADWLRARYTNVKHYQERNIWDLEFDVSDGDNVITWFGEVKGKRSFDVYRDTTGFDFNDWLKYQEYPHFYIFFIDHREKLCYGDSVTNLKKHAFQKYDDGTKANKFKLISFKIDKMRKLFKLTQDQIAKLKILEKEQATKDFDLISCIIE